MFVTFTSGLNDALPVGPAGGDLSGTYPNPNARGLHETAGPTQLLYGSIPDQTFLRRVGATVVGVDPNTTVKGPFSSVLWVDPTRGNDTTAVRGNDNLPFATIQAAVNAMSTGDTVQLAPLDFETTTAITVPATVIRASLVGGGGVGGGGVATPPTTNNTVTIIRCTGDHVLNLGANLGLPR